MSEKSKQRFLVFKEQIRQESLESEPDLPAALPSKSPIMKAQLEKTLSIKRMSTIKKLQ